MSCSDGAASEGLVWRPTKNRGCEVSDRWKQTRWKLVCLYRFRLRSHQIRCCNQTLQACVQQGEPRLLDITGPVVSQPVVWFPVFMCAGTAATKKLSLKKNRRSARFGVSALTELQQLNFNLMSAKLKFSDMVSEVPRLVVK